MSHQKEARYNRYRKIYIWTNNCNDDPESMVPYGSGVMQFTPSITRADMTTRLTKMADDDPSRDIYFAFKSNGTRWRVFKTDEVDLDFDSLFRTPSNEQQH